MKFGSLLASGVVALNLVAMPASHSHAERPKSRDTFTEESPRTGADPNIATLYRHDSIAGSFDVIRKAYGDCYSYCYSSDGSMELCPKKDDIFCGAHLEIFWRGQLNTNLPTSLVTGLQGGTKGAAVDLGTLDEMNERYKGSLPDGYTSMSRGKWFSTLRISGKRVFATFWNGDKATPIPIPESSGLFPSKSDSYYSIPAKVGHVYLLRQFDPGFEDVVFKVIVLAMTEDSITVRFALMRNEDFTPKPRATPGAPVK